LTHFLALKKISFVITLGLFLTVCGCRQPPAELLQRAQAALDSAAQAEAVRYSEPIYRRAETTLKCGWMEMARQNGRFGPFRDYALADSLLFTAFTLADSAAKQAQDAVHLLKTRAQTEFSLLQEELGNWREALDGSLSLYTAEHYWTKADLGLKMSESLIRQEEYQEALEATSHSREALHRVGELLAEYANDEVKSIVSWQRWVQETIAESRNSGGHAIIVNKTAHKAYLLRDGNIIHTYDCELGYNSARQKLFAGDGATPEGRYRVTSVRHNGSKYHKALMLDYPNTTDNRRFAENKRRGIISRNTRIGRNIEIHGGGGRGQDWTDGCVALTDEDMNHLIRFVTIGTPVTIVRRSDHWP